MENLLLESKHLRLIPITLEECELFLNRSYRRSVKQIHDDLTWPTQDTLDILPMIHKTLKVTRTPTGFECWKIILKQTDTVIGDIGFHSHPDANGCVEIGYGLISSEQGKGYGYEALTLLMSWTLKQRVVKTIKAECLIDNHPSIRLLQKIGMKEVDRNDITIRWEFIYPNKM